MNDFDPKFLKNLYRPPTGSHKGQNGKLMIIGGSHLFHGAPLWALKTASRIVDMVFFASTPEVNELAQKLKSDLFDFIAVPRNKIDYYINEADAVLIGSGLPREPGQEKGDEPTRKLTQKVLLNYPKKKFVIDAGSLTEMEPEWLKQLNGNVIITPHRKEFEWLFNLKAQSANLKTATQNSNLKDLVQEKAREYDCVILLKGHEDLVCSKEKCIKVVGGNPGMTKGGTGDVLAGLVAALYCKNKAFLAAACASFINKKAGDNLYQRVGPYFNASDLCDEIPKVMNQLITANS